MNIFITGAAGFIGSNLAERLCQAGHTVSGIDSFTDYYDVQQKRRNAAAIRAAGAGLIEGDLVTADLAPLLEGVQVIYHVAAQPGISSQVDFQTYQRNNIEATYRLLEAARQSRGLAMFVNVATSSVYGYHATEPETAAPQPASYYGVTKLAAEQLVMAYQRDQGFPACSLRLFSVYGERERPDKLYPRLIRSVLTGEPMPLYEGSREHSRSFTYVGDVVQGFMRVLDHPAVAGEIINIGSDEEITTGEAIDIVQELMGQEANFELKPPRPGDQLRTCAVIDKARSLLGYEPATSFREGIRHEIEWMRDMVAEQAGD